MRAQLKSPVSTEERPRLVSARNDNFGSGGEDVVIIGAGAAGLSTAYELKRRGISARILDKADCIANPWRNRHPQLRLNTHRDLSQLSGLAMPASTAPFPAREAIIGYLEDYADFVGAPIDFGVEVVRVDRAPLGWTVVTSRGSVSASQVVVASGRESVPHIPDWPGRQGFKAKLVHSADFGDARTYEGKRVLVVGAGNSGTDVLNHLAKIRTAALHVAIRTGPTIFPSRFLGIPLQRLSPVMDKLPCGLTDNLLRATEWLAFGNLSKFGLRQPPLGAATRLGIDGVSPAVDDGFIAALKAGRVRVVAEVVRFEENVVLLADGSRMEPDVVICATGYRTGLEPMLGHLDVLDRTGVPLANGRDIVRHSPGLRFIGMRTGMTGYFHAACKHSREIADQIESELGSRGAHAGSDGGGARVATAA